MNFDWLQYQRGPPVEEVLRLSKIFSTEPAHNPAINTKEEKDMNLATTTQPTPAINIGTEVTYAGDGEILLVGKFYLGAVKGKRTADNSNIKESSSEEIAVPARILTVPVTAAKSGQAIKFWHLDGYQWGFVVSVEPSQKHEKDVAVRVLVATNHIFTFEVAQEMYVCIVPDYKEVFPATLRKKAFADTLLAMAKMQATLFIGTAQLLPYANAVYTLVENSKFIGLDRTNELLDALMVKFLMQ